MDRRRCLTALAGAIGGVAGCLDNRNGEQRSGDRTPTTGATGTTPQPLRRGDVTLPIPTTEMVAAVHRDHIPAIVDPAFAADWDELSLPADSDGETTRLPSTAPVVGVERGGGARAYPLRVLEWHEVVNDSLGGPLLVTYCVQCGSAVVAERVVRGAATVFGVSGYLWRSDLVLYDRATGSLWSQLLATAVNGPATGDELRVLPSSLTTWGAWRADHPDTVVLLPPPHSNTVRGPDARYDYFEPKYSYGESVLIGYEGTGNRLHPQDLVLGVESGDVSRAYPARVVADERGGVVNDTVGSRPVVVTTAPGRTLVAYDRRVGGETLVFAAPGGAEGEDEAEDGDGDETGVFLRAGGSRWRRTTGVAVDGPHRGTRLTRANDLPPMFWLGWSKFHPETAVYGSERDRE